MFTHIAAEEGEGSSGVGGGVPQPLFPVTYMVLSMVWYDTLQHIPASHTQSHASAISAEGKKKSSDPTLTAEPKQIPRSPSTAEMTTSNQGKGREETRHRRHES